VTALAGKRLGTMRDRLTAAMRRSTTPRAGGLGRRATPRSQRAAGHGGPQRRILVVHGLRPHQADRSRGLHPDRCRATGGAGRVGRPRRPAIRQYVAQPARQAAHPGLELQRQRLGDTHARAHADAALARLGDRRVRASTESANRRWCESIVLAFDQLLGDRYPFVSGRSVHDARVADLEKFFQPGSGTLWQYFNEVLKNDVEHPAGTSLFRLKEEASIPLQAGPARVPQAGRDITQFLFKDGGKLGLNYAIRIRPSPPYEKVTFRTGPTSIAYFNSREGWRDASWPARGASFDLVSRAGSVNQGFGRATGRSFTCSTPPTSWNARRTPRNFCAPAGSRISVARSTPTSGRRRCTNRSAVSRCRIPWWPGRQGARDDRRSHRRPVMNPTIGVYGKVPAQADFVRGNVGEMSRLGLDRWFQDAHEVVHSEHHRLPAEPTHFALRPGGRTGRAGRAGAEPGLGGAGLPDRHLRARRRSHGAGRLCHRSAGLRPVLQRRGRGPRGAQAATAADLTARAQALGDALTPERNIDPVAVLGAERMAPLGLALAGCRTAPLMHCGRCSRPATGPRPRPRARRPGSSPSMPRLRPTPSACSGWRSSAAVWAGNDAQPTFLWTNQSARLLVGLGPLSNTLLSFLANPRHKSGRLWPLRTDVDAAHRHRHGRAHRRATQGARVARGHAGRRSGAVSLAARFAAA